ncbi:MAG: hypothetical protein PHT33_08550 [bacterium]|nr:hypothetical protein [bacterium]
MKSVDTNKAGIASADERRKAIEEMLLFRQDKHTEGIVKDMVEEGRR